MSYGEMVEKYATLTDDEKAALLARYNVRPISGGDGSDDEDEDDEDEGDEDEDQGDDEDDSGKTGERRSKKEKVYRTQQEFDRAFSRKLKAERAKLTDALTASITEQVQKDLNLAEQKKKGNLQAVIDDLKPKADKVDALEKEVKVWRELADARFEAFVDTLPEAIRDLAPDDDASPQEKERWIIMKATPLMQKMEKQQRRRKPAEPDEDEDDEEDEDEDADERTRSKRRRAAPVLGNNPWQPIPGGKTPKRQMDEIVAGFKASGQYQPM